MVTFSRRSLFAFALVCCLLLGAFSPVNAGPMDEYKARAALALSDSQVSTAIPTPATADQPCEYADACSDALTRRVPLLVFVGQKAKRPQGCECAMAEADRIGNDGSPGVAVYDPAGGKLVHRYTITGTPSAEIIAALIHPQPVRSPQAISAPFPVNTNFVPSNCPNGKCPLKQ